MIPVESGEVLSTDTSRHLGSKHQLIDRHWKLTISLTLGI